jgi:hypothetical protein
MNYANPRCSLFSLEEQHFYNRLFRILVRRYLRDQYLPAIISSTKYGSAKRRDHLKVLRYLEGVLASPASQAGEV